MKRCPYNHGRSRFVLLGVTLFLSSILLVPTISASVRTSLLMQPSAAVTAPPVILQPGTTGTSIIYTNSTSAKVSVAAPAPLPTYYPNDYNVLGANWWNGNYACRKRVTISNNVATNLSSGYSVLLAVDTASLVSAGKLLPNGEDLRIVYWNGSACIELDRDITDMNTNYTQIWFKTQSNIAASSSDRSYYLYHGNPSAQNPPANKSKVYDFWDDFNDGSLDAAWTFSQIGGATGSCSEAGTTVTLNATNTGDLWDTSDNFLFLSISRGYDVLVESRTSSWGGSHNTWSKMGGVQLRQNLDSNSKNRVMSPVYSAVGATNSYRLSTGGVTNEQTSVTQPAFCRISRMGNSSNSWYSTDGKSWTELGSQTTFTGGLYDPVRLGVHLAGISSSAHWVEIDWFKVRKYVEPEPTTSLGSEDWWNSNYKYRKQIAIKNNAASQLESDYSVVLTLDTASLVSSGKMLANGNDLRVVYGWTEIDRDVINMNTSQTQVWFKTRTRIGISATDLNYYMYYGYSSAGSPPANRTNVYVFWDDFDDGDISDWLSMVGTWFVSNDQSVSGAYSMKATTGGDSWIKPSAAINEADVELEAYIRVAGGGEDWGIAARAQSGTAKSWYQANPAGTYWAIGRFVSDSWSYLATGTPEPAASTWYRVNLRIRGTQAQILVNGSQRVPSAGWTDVGTDFSGGTITLTTWDVGAGAWFDNIRLRRFTEPEPSLYLQDEESSFYVSGTLPSSVQNVDSDYFVTRTAGTSTSKHFPSNYSLTGDTRAVAGLLSNLPTDDGKYMTLRSYVNQTSTTNASKAFISYRSSTLNGVNYPKYRLWNGTVWNGENEAEMWAGSDIRWVRTAFCTKSERALERIVITLCSDGYFDAYVWDGPGTSWVVTNDIAYSGISANAYRCFDIAYEKTTGRALLVYSRGTTTNEIGYRVWDGLSWGSEQLLNLPYTIGVVRWVALATKPTTGANEIAMIYIDANNDVFGYVWTGSTWSQMSQTAVWDSTAAISAEESIAVEYEQMSGRALFIWGDSVSTDNYYRIWNGSALENTTLLDIPAQGAITNWVTLKGDPTSDGLLYTLIDGASHLDTAYWNGSTWTVHTEHDSAVDTDARRCADFDWETTGSKGLLVYGTTTGQITYKTFAAPDTWGNATSVTMRSGSSSYIHPWVQLRHTTRALNGDVQVLGAVLEGTAFDLGAIKWNGTTFTVIGASTFTTDTGLTTYECFNLKFSIFGDPTESIMEVEFTGTSNAENWTQLTWTVDSGWTQGSVDVELQLFNYTLGDYQTSGSGYISYTSSVTPDTDETKNQVLTTNVTDFRDSSGNWRIKVRGVKASLTTFDFKADYIEFKPFYLSNYTVSTEFMFSSMTPNTPTQLNFTVTSDYDIENVSVTIQVWNYSSSAYVTSGEGHLSYTSTGSNETKLLSINTDPQFYSSGGCARIKTTGVESTTIQYLQRTNQLKLEYTYNSSSTYNPVLKVVNLMASNWQIRLKVYNSSSIARVSNATVSFHDGSLSDQITVTDGNITQSQGPVYGLAGSATVYISMSNLQASTAGTSCLYVYLEIRAPNTTTYSLYTIAFEIT